MATLAILNFFTIALRSDGLVFGTGTNTNGQLGDNTVTSRLTFVQAIGISNAIAVAAGQYHSVALRSDGLVFTTGDNTEGALGINSTLGKSTFVQAINP